MSPRKSKSHIKINDHNINAEFAGFLSARLCTKKVNIHISSRSFWLFPWGKARNTDLPYMLMDSKRKIITKSESKQ